MKYLFIILLSVLCSQCHNLTPTRKIIDSVRERYVPDPRTAVFSVYADYNSSKIILHGETDQPEAHLILLQKLDSAGYNVEDSIIELPSGPASPRALVSLSVASMRLQPSHDAELTTQATMGTPLKVLKQDDDWAFVQTPDNYLAWCEKDAIRLCSGDEFLRWKNSKRVIVTKWFDFLKDPSTHEVIADVIAGCILEYVSSDKDGTIVTTPDGRKGMISSADVIDFDTWKNKDGQTGCLINTAKTFMGTPYLWGGASIKAIDCSGFVKTVYFLNGIILSRDASQQALYGKDIPPAHYNAFQPGDLVFFGNHARNGKPVRITHVGMYLGNSEFIHSSGYVKINSFDSTRANYSHYRTISLLKVRRILGTSGPAGIVQVRNHPWY